MTDSQFAAILVYTTSYAIRAEKLLTHAGITTKLIPVPRHLSSDCGVCVRIHLAESTHAQKILMDNKCEIEGVFPI